MQIKTVLVSVVVMLFVTTSSDAAQAPNTKKPGMDAKLSAFEYFNIRRKAKAKAAGLWSLVAYPPKNPHFRKAYEEVNAARRNETLNPAPYYTCAIRVNGQHKLIPVD